MLEAVIGMIGASGAVDTELVTAGMGASFSSYLGSIWSYVLIFIGFSLVVFFHELGHFLAAKACGVRVHKFAIGFGKELFGFDRGETRYSFNALPLGGYVKMLGQEDFGDKEDELIVKDDPRSFLFKPPGQRMIIVSAGVIMNMVFAALVFMIVFMIGMESPTAVVGWILPGSPAEQAGLQVGDWIVKVHDEWISDQNDLRAAVVLSDPDEPLHLTYQRKDRESGKVRTETVTILPEKNAEKNILQIGVAPPLNTSITAAMKDLALSDEEQLQAGDKILQVNGRDISSLFEASNLLTDLKGRFAELKVRRAASVSGADAPGAVERTVKRRARMALTPEGRFGESSGHLLGLVPRIRVTDVVEGQRADQAGILPGDVLVRWGSQVAPRLDEYKTSIENNPERAIPVEVLRYKDGKPQVVVLKVVPKVPGWFSKRSPQIGAEILGHENDEVVVADILTEGVEKNETPAARLKAIMPRGSKITKVNDQPVATWDELVERFTKLAGTDVKLTWVHENQPEVSATLHVPHTLGTTFELPGARTITSINGQTNVEIEKDGRRRSFTVDSWQGAREVLSKCVGKTVDIEFWDQADRVLHKEKLAVTAEMVDPWVLRVQYVIDIASRYEVQLVRETNPVKAMMIGVRKTYYFIGQAYLAMKRMIFTRSLGLDQISGPIGIIKIGSDVAQAGIPELLYFLAMMSANLAVINFLPLPIFDGGLFVFLIIEKIKGTPISIRVQVATQMIGLVLIIGIFVLVTFQDIIKLGGWE